MLRLSLWLTTTSSAMLVFAMSLSLGWGRLQRADMVAFSQNHNNILDIAAVDVHTRLQVNLTQNSAEDKDAAWSPDGSRLSYLSDQLDSVHVYVLDFAGNDTHLITPYEGDETFLYYPYELPQWSADGERVVVFRHVVNRWDETTLLSINVKNGEATQINQDHPDGVHYIETLQFGEVDSPNGRYRALLDVTDDQQAIGLFLVENGERRLLYTVGGMNDYQRSVFSWSPDSQHIALIVTKNDTRQLLIVNVETGNMRVLAQNADPISAPAWRP